MTVTLDVRSRKVDMMKSAYIMLLSLSKDSNFTLVYKKTVNLVKIEADTHTEEMPVLMI